MIKHKYYGIISFITVNICLLAEVITRFSLIILSIEWTIEVHKLYGVYPFFSAMWPIINPLILITYLLGQPFFICCAIYLNKTGGGSMKAFNYYIIGLHSILYIVIVAWIFYILNDPDACFSIFP
jgi:hypothetical protein